MLEPGKYQVENYRKTITFESGFEHRKSLGKF